MHLLRACHLYGGVTLKEQQQKTEETEIFIFEYEVLTKHCELKNTERTSKSKMNKQKQEKK